MSEKEKSQLDLKSLIDGYPYLRQILDNLDQVVWMSDLRGGHILYVSPAFETVWGQSCESLYNDPQLLTESIHPEDRLQVLATRQRDDHQPYTQAYRILRPDGSICWIFTRTFMIYDDAGEPNLLFCVAQDITNQKQAELALRRALESTREQFSLSRKMSLARKPEVVLKTVLSTPELRSAHRAALLFFDDPKNGSIRGVELAAIWQANQNLPAWVNESSLYEEPAFWKLFVPNRTVVIGGVQSNPRLAPLVRDILLEGHIQSMVIFPLVAAGGWRGSLLVYYTQDHHFVHSELRRLKVLIDQASIILYNLQLLAVEEDSRHEAERANKVKTEFLAMISHELRTPLTSILGFTTTLLAEDVGWEPDEQRDFIQTVQREANRLQELIDHLLDLSRLEAQMLPISLGSHSLDEIVEDALPQIHSLTSEHTLTLHLPATLPPVYVDAKRIAQVLVNLVRNASNYAPKGTEISISAVAREGFAQINISDQGPGIPPADQKRVFEAFRRGLNVEKDSSPGAGLGLAICKGLVEAHGGRIWVKKKSTPGATISFTIPLVSMDALAMTAEEER